MQSKLLEISVVGGVCIYILNILRMVIMSQLNKKKDGNSTQLESDIREESRRRIEETHNKVVQIASREEHFFHMKNQVEDMAEIITMKNPQQVPLIYNPGLDKAMDKLNDNTEALADNIKTQTKAIADLSKNINGKDK